MVSWGIGVLPVPCFFVLFWLFFFFNEPENVYLTFLLSLYVPW